MYGSQYDHATKALIAVDNRDILEAFEFIQSHVDDYGQLHINPPVSGQEGEGEVEEEDQDQDDGGEPHECDNPDCSSYGPVMVPLNLLIF